MSRQMPETASRNDPFPGFKFLLELNSIPVGGFSECSGLDLELEVEEYAEGGENRFVHKLPGRRKQSDLVLKRGLSGMIASIFAALLLSVIVFGPPTRMRSEVGKMNARHDARTRVNSRNTAHAPKSTTPLFKGKEDQDYASRLPKQNRGYIF